MRLSYFILCFFVIGPLAFSVDSNDSFLDSLLDEEEKEVNCSNIMDFIQSYLELSEKNQALVSVSANRFLSAVISNTQRTTAEMEQLKKDIFDSMGLLEDNQYILSGKVGIIMEKLPDCIKK